MNPKLKYFLLGMLIMFLLSSNWPDFKRGFMDGWNGVESSK
ncbi:hypothetical protein [Pedobacter psychrophilus]|nr:hypothetical protein [Pedobacter psychrophilus]